MPGITACNWRIIEHVLLRAGFEFARQTGEHRAYVKDPQPRPVIVPEFDDVPAAVIRNIIENAHISQEEYFRLLPG